MNYQWHYDKLIETRKEREVSDVTKFEKHQFINESKEEYSNKILDVLENIPEESDGYDAYWKAVSDNGRLKYLTEFADDYSFYQELKNLSVDELKKIWDRIEKIRGHLNGKSYGL